MSDPEEVSARIRRLSDPEQAYLARWVGVMHPDVAEQALAALAAYRRDHPDKARAFLGPETGPC